MIIHIVLTEYDSFNELSIEFKISKITSLSRFACILPNDT